MCNTWFDTFDGCFFITITTVVLSSVAVCFRYCYRSKCQYCNLCFGAITIKRDVEGEEKLDEMGSPNKLSISC
jgi:hypothetical protein